MRTELPSHLTVPGATLQDLERWVVTETLARLDGNKTKAAKVLGIDRRTLYRKLEQYDRDSVAGAA